MLYYNKVSKETKSLADLCRDENTSIAAGLEFGQWLPVKQDAFPEVVPEGVYYDLGPIEMRDGEAFQTWVQIQAPEMPQPAEPIPDQVV